MTTYTTYFRKAKSPYTILEQSLSFPYIAITCVDTGWNDFGYNYRAKMEVVPENGRPPFICNLQVMPIENNAPARRLDTWVDSLPLASLMSYDSAPQNNETAIRFISLLARESDHRELSNWTTGQEELREILLSISDVVFARQISLYRVNILNALINTPNFRLAMLRSGSAYHAFFRAGRLLRPSGQAPITDSRKAFSFRCTLKGFDSSNHELNIGYIDTPIYEDRIHCLIGINGSGKTRLLREFLLTLGSRADTSDTQIFLDNYQSGTSATIECDAPAFNRVLTFTSDLQQSYPTATCTDSLFEYMHFPLVQVERESGSTSENIARMLVSVFRDPELLANTRSRYDLIKQSLQGYVDIESIYLPLTPDSIGISSDILIDNDLPWIKLGDVIRAGGEQRSLELSSRLDENRDVTLFGERNEKIQMSSGQSVFFRFGLHFMSYVDVGTLVILDEPETHLHPNLICDFMTLLHKVLKLTKSVAIIATHSPYIVREIPTHCVHAFTEDDEGGIQIGSVYLKTLGASISSISQAVFGDPTVRKYHEELARQVANS